MATKKVLMVVTNVDQVPGTDIPTGFFLRELTHPYHEAREGGFDVDVASINGGRVPIDPHSDPRDAMSKVKDDMVSMGFLATPVHAAEIENSLRLADVDLSGYDAIFFSGGAGAIFDLPHSPEVHAAIRAVWDQGGVVGAVCHGSAALLDATLADGGSLVADQEVSGLTTQEERNIQAGIAGYAPPFLIEEELPKRGALFRKAPADTPFAITSGGGRLVTGQNNASGTVTGRALVEALRARYDSSAG